MKSEFRGNLPDTAVRLISLIQTKLSIHSERMKVCNIIWSRIYNTGHLVSDFLMSQYFEENSMDIFIEKVPQLSTRNSCAHSPGFY